MIIWYLILPFIALTSVITPMKVFKRSFDRSFVSMSVLPENKARFSPTLFIRYKTCLSSLFAIIELTSLARVRLNTSERSIKAIKHSGSLSSSMNPCSKNYLLRSRIFIGSRIASRPIYFLKLSTSLGSESRNGVQFSLLALSRVSLALLKKSSTRNFFIMGL